MRKRLLPSVMIAGCLLLGACVDAGEEDGLATLPAKYKRLLPLHEKLPKPKPGEWLDQHREPGQTYRQYIKSQPVRPTSRRNVIYVLPLGEFSTTQRKIIHLTAKNMEIYFGLKVRVEKDLSLDAIPKKARRVHPTWGDEQILSTYVLDDLLRPRLPKDAVCYIAFTTSDLWPGEGWNFVFGQASLQQRVGVWSIYRNGDPDQSEAAFKLCLRRTIKTATHETGHMFSMYHCIYYKCNMCGSNHRAESDSHPMWLCPVCLAKLCWANRLDPEKRYERLLEFAKENGLETEQEFYEKSLAALRAEE